MNPRPIFIVGSPRSGTALLRDLLRAHPNITFPGESHFIPTFYRAYGDPRTESDAIRLAHCILSTHWVKSWGLDLKPSLFKNCRSFREVVTLLYTAWANKEGKMRWGDKTPQYGMDIALLRKIFPDCQIINIYRDGRDAALSILAAGFGPQNMFTAAHQWRHFMETVRIAGAALPADAYCELRYEDILNAPQKTLETVLDFLDEPFNESVLKPNFLERQERHLVIGQAERSYVSRTRIVTNNTGKWKTQMEDQQQIRFESVAGSMLAELGYQSRDNLRPISSVEAFYWKVHQYFFWMFQKLNTRHKHPATVWLMLSAKLRYLVKERQR